MILSSTATLAQSIQEVNKDFALMNYDKAIAGYERQITKLKNVSPSVEVVQNLANSYFFVKDYENAKKTYGMLHSLQGSSMNESLFLRYVSLLKTTSEIEKANDLLKSYYANNTSKIKMLGFQKTQLDSLDTELYEVVNVAVNSNVSDFGTTLYGNEIVFSSSRSAENGSSFYNMYTATRNPENGQLSSPKEFMTNLNTDYHDATPTFSPDNSIIFFSRNYLTKKNKLDAPNGGVSNVMIMKGRVMNNKIVDVVQLDFNSKDYNCSQPFMSADGKYLYFSSDMPGGFGGSDLYLAEVASDGTVGAPTNLGSMINSAGSELFPSASGDTLFFSSDGHFGFGGLDVFISKIAGKTNFSVPVNAGQPINSNTDDFAFVKMKNNTAYFSSDRKGGKGNDDIYWIKMEESIKFVDYSGTVLTKGDDKPIPNAKIQVFDGFNDLVTEIVSDENGKFDAQLPLNSQLKIVFSKPEYSTETVNVSTPEKAVPMKDNDVRLTSFASLIVKDEGIEKIKVDPIYFDYGKWDITPQAIVELDKILFAMEKFPMVKIKIESHTDSRGSDSYNLKLSDNRAKSTMTYLLSKGIDSSRIESANGYGETRLRNNCKNGVKCSEEEHFINRRSDFIVISK